MTQPLHPPLPRPALRETPPSLQRNVPDDLPPGRAPVILILGSSGFRSCWQAGVVDPLEDLGRPIRFDLASGGTIPGLALAAGINKHWRRVMNAGAPTDRALQRIDGLRWFERRNLDLGGVYRLDVLENWLADWLRWAGVRTFRDLRYAPGEDRPRGVAHRVGISVVLWRTARSFERRCTAEELRDPVVVHRLFRWAFHGRQFPWKSFRQVWIPDSVAEHLPWLADEIDDHSPAFWARVSMSQWPACLPTVLQDPTTRQLIFLADGGHIDNQPSLFNDGRVPDFPMLNPRLMQNVSQDSRAQQERDVRRMPFGRVVRFEVTPETRIRSLQGDHLTADARDSMWARGRLQGTQRLPDEFRQLADQYTRMRDLAAQGIRIRVEVPAFHGFQAVAAAERPGRIIAAGLRS